MQAPFFLSIIFLTTQEIDIMNYEEKPIIIPFLKVINGVQLVLWDYAERAEMYEQFIMMGDEYAEYTPIRFESL